MKTHQSQPTKAAYPRLLHYCMTLCLLVSFAGHSPETYAVDANGCEWAAGVSPAWILDYTYDINPLVINDESTFSCYRLCQLYVKSSLACFWPATCHNYCVNARAEACAGNPIELYTGNKIQTETDYRGGGNYPLTIVRNYSSSDRAPADNFGQGWAGVGVSQVHAQALGASPDRITVIKQNGKDISFSVDSSNGNVFTPLSVGEKSTLEGKGNFEGSGNDVWKFVSPSGVTEIYIFDFAAFTSTGDTLSPLWMTISKNGLRHMYQYDANNRLQTISDDYGRQLAYTYYSGGSNDGKIETITIPGNKVFTYQYDVLGNLEYVLYPDATPGDLLDNPKKQYHYEDDHLDVADKDGDGDVTERLYPYHLTGITDERGNRFATFAFDSDGRGILSEHAGGVDRIEVLDYTGETRTIRNALGKETTFTFSNVGSGENAIKRTTQVEGHASTFCNGDISSTTYDSNGLKDTVVDSNNNTTDYTIDTDGFESQRIEAQGNIAERTINSTWDKVRFLPDTVEVADHKLTDYDYDNQGRIDLITETDLVTVGQPTRTWDYSYTFHFYDPDGDSVDNETKVATITVDGPRTDITDTTTQTFDTQGLLTQVDNAAGHITQLLEHNAEGLPETLIDANNVTTELRYTLRGWLDTKTLKSAQGDALTDYDYYDNGLVRKITLPNAVELNYEYDAAQRLTRITNGKNEYIEYGLNLLGNRETETIHSDTGDIVRQQVKAFDELGRLMQNFGVNSQILEEFDYDDNGNINNIADNNLVSIVRLFDGLNRLQQETDRELGVTAYTYDDLDQIDTVTDANNLVTDYDYNGFGQLTKLDSPDTGITNYTDYDLAGNLKAKTDARGVVTQYTYDALNRLVDVIFPANTAQNYTFTYDDETSGNKGIGQRTGITKANGNSIAWKFDDRGNITQDTRVIGGVPQVTHYQYDLADNLTQITYPNERIVTYVRDTLTAQVTSITSKKNAAVVTPQTLVSNITYKPFGPVNTLTFDNGITQTKEYDLHYRPDTVVTVGGGVTLQDVNYAFDLVGTLNPITDNQSASKTQTLTYDSLYRLTDATGGYGTFQYGLDATGNRTARTLTGTGNDFTESLNYTNPITTNQLQGITGGSNPRTLTYTDNGNIETDSTGRSYVYDDNNRLVEAKDNASSIATYGYNALGQRDSKTTTSGTGHFVYGLDAKLLYETIPQSMVIIARTYVYLDGVPIAMIEDETPIQTSSMLPAGPMGFFVLLILAILFYRYRTSLVNNQALLRGLVVPLLAFTGLACGPTDPGDDGTNTYFYVNDHLGTPQMLTDKDKAVVWQAEYTPFGEITEDTNNSVEQPLRMPGQYQDYETGLYYNLTRDYDPSLGQYIQSDSIGLAGGMNTYAYAQGNPVMYSDPSGEFVMFLPFLPVITGIDLAIGGGLVCLLTGCGDVLGNLLAEMVNGGSATGPAPYTHAEEREARNLTPNPFGDNCDEMRYAAVVLEAQIAWRRTDLNPLSPTFGAHKAHIALLEGELRSLKRALRDICGDDCDA